MSVLIGFHKKKKQKKMFLFVTILLINDTFDVRVILWNNVFNLGASFLNWDSLLARLNSHYTAWAYKQKKAALTPGHLDQ